MTPGILSIGVSSGAERGQDVQPYPVLDRATATLTMREHETHPRAPIPASDWDLAPSETKDGRLVLTPRTSTSSSSMLRHATHDTAGIPNPLAGHVEKIRSTRPCG